MNITVPILRLNYCKVRPVNPEQQEGLGELCLDMVTNCGAISLYMTRDHADAIARSLGNAVAAYDMEYMEVEQEA